MFAALARPSGVPRATNQPTYISNSTWFHSANSKWAKNYPRKAVLTSNSNLNSFAARLASFFHKPLLSLIVDCKGEKICDSEPRQWISKFMWILGALTLVSAGLGLFKFAPPSGLFPAIVVHHKLSLIHSIHLPTYVGRRQREAPRSKTDVLLHVVERGEGKGQRQFSQKIHCSCRRTRLPKVFNERQHALHLWNNH